jgi:23S rRNA (guanosine2251-2'-O)-methyltransferase
MATAKTHPDNDPFAGESSPEEDFWFFQCTSGDCRLRFPAPAKPGLTCPFCKSPVEKTDRWQASSNDRTFKVTGASQLSVILDNLRSAYNVGSIMRSSDGAGIQHAYLCGITPTPLLHPRLAKTALTAEIRASWSYHSNGVELVQELKKSGTRIIGLETSPQAKNLLEEQSQENGPIALVVGNEVCGIDPAILALCDEIYFLPMLGIKKSLNVSVSFGIAAYLLNRHTFVELPVQSNT